MDFKSIDTDETLIKLRAEKFQDLPHFQEYFLEMQVYQGKSYTWKSKDAHRGYLIVDSSGETLLEYHSSTLSLTDNKEILKELIKEFHLKGCYVKSFDQPLLNTMILKGYTPQPQGILFRRTMERQAVSLGPIKESLADESDISEILSVSDDFFEGPKELMDLIHINGLYLYRDTQEKLIGCGLMQPVIKGYPYWDIGMVTAPDFRKKGYGSLIIQRMKDRALDQGYLPICGCEVNNFGSLKCLRNAGFLDEHLLLFFSLS